PQRGHRALGPGRLGDLPGEADAGRRERVEVRAGLALVAVDVEVVRPQRVDEDEEHVQVAAIAEGEHVLERASRARVAMDAQDEGPEAGGAGEQGNRGDERHDEPPPRQSRSALAPAHLDSKLARAARFAQRWRSSGWENPPAGPDQRLRLRRTARPARPAMPV